MLKKNMKKFYTIFFILYQKIPLVSSLENSPYFIFFPKDDRATIIYNFLFLRPCTLFVLQTLQKPLPILYQISKLFLNLTYRISSYKTRGYYFFISYYQKLLNFTYIKVCQVRALLEMRVLFKGGPYMRKYGRYLKRFEKT